MKRVLFIAVVGLFVYGCSNSGQKTAPAAAQPEQNQVVITNNMENAAAMVPSWINEKTVVKMENGKAHSGEYVTRVDANDVYSYAYRENFQNISEKLPKRVIVNGWVNSTVIDKAISIIVDINEDNKSFFWKAYSLNETIKKANEWTEFTAYFTIDQPIKKNQQIKIFAFGGGKTAYFDDFRITFEY